MFKPFSPADLKSEHEDLSETKVVPGEKWRKWQLEQLPSKEQQQVRLAEAETKTFVRDAELTKLRETARQEAWEEGFTEGSKSGYEAGYSEGLAAAKAAVEAEKQQQIATAVTPIQNLASAFSEALSELDEAVAEQLVKLAFDTGNQLARDHLDANPEVVLKIVRELMHTEPTFTNKPRLFVNPDDFSLIEEHLRDELQAAGWKLVSDDRLSRGGCRLVSQTGERDASWESRWQALATKMLANENSTTGDSE